MKESANKFVLLCVLAFAFGSTTAGQTVVDKTVATVSDRVRTELITHSDLVWQLALQPNAPLDPPRDEDLRRALQTQINQRIFALEAQRLPRAAPTEAEIAAEIANILKFFPSTAEFERRLRLVGFTSIKDPNFEAIISQRLTTEKYIDFRFRSFVVITADDEAKYYRETWAPDFARRNPGAIVPSLEDARPRVNQALVEERVATGIETFLEEAKRRVEIVELSDVKR